MCSLGTPPTTDGNRFMHIQQNMLYFIPIPTTLILIRTVRAQRLSQQHKLSVVNSIKFLHRSINSSINFFLFKSYEILLYALWHRCAAQGYRGLYTAGSCVCLHWKFSSVAILTLALCCLYTQITLWDGSWSVGLKICKKTTGVHNTAGATDGGISKLITEAIIIIVGESLGSIPPARSNVRYRGKWSCDTGILQVLVIFYISHFYESIVAVPF